MKQTTIMIIPEGTDRARQMRLPVFVLRLGLVLGVLASGLAGYFVFDYAQLRDMRSSFRALASENEGLKGEARILMSHLEEVKRSLRQVHDYTSKLGEITKVQTQKVSLKTGIGPLTEEEFETAKLTPPQEVAKPEASESNFLPAGLNPDGLVFKPVFARLASIGHQAGQHALELQHLLSTLSQQKNLLSSIPSISPVDGWITSGYGQRISPFTGQTAQHRGIDIAAPVGTPVVAPADGVVIFTGAKAGFGNFIMIAHGYGVVTRYGHNHQNMVQPGQKVKRGDQIATVGSTGRTTGPHLHYEIWLNGQTKNPKSFILDLNEFQIY